MVDFSKFTDWLKLKPRYLVAIFFITGILLFSYENWLLKLGLNEIVENYRGWIGGIFLLSAILLFVNGLAYLTEPLQVTFNNWKQTQIYSKSLKSLSSDEKEVLKRYLEEDTQSQRLGYMDGLAQGLAAKKILYRSSSMGTASGYFAYNIQPWAWDYLNKHPELLE